MIDTSHFHLKAIKSTATFGQFEMSPLFGGFGHTLGNSLRRVLLITVPGAAITRIKVAGATHLFTTLSGVKEDLVEISLNLKKVKFTYNSEDPTNLVLEKKGKGVVTAGDIADSTACKVANPDQVIATLTDDKAKLKIEMQVERGVGYTMAKEQKTDVVGEIILDATFTPVLKANYTVEPTRLGKKSDYDKLTMDVWTDGSVSPEAALKSAAKDLINSLGQIFDTQEFSDEIITIASNPGSILADISVEEIELPLRVTNALKKAGFGNIDTLTKGGRTEVSKSKNVGEKSLKVIDSWLKEKGYSWSK